MGLSALDVTVNATSSAVLDDPAACLDHPSGYLALARANQRFSVPGQPGFVAYRAHGRHWIAFGGALAPVAARAALLDAFLKAALEARRGVLVVQVRGDQVALFRARGFVVNQLGTSFALALTAFDLRGTAKMQLRNKISRARKAGLVAVELGHDVPREAAAFADLDAVSAAWLRGKGKPELQFMIGELGAPADTARRVFLVRDATARPLGFITYVPAYGQRPGYLHDLTRRVPDAPPGVLELANATAIERLRAEGVPYLHFGFTPFVVDEDEPEADSRFAAWLVRLLYRRGAFVYPAATQAHYKLKWGPAVIEREYLAARPLSLRGIVDLLRLTRSL
jgi:lysylphosphatidylglycerol synthetase-like protein (DUF2156 family)